VVDISLMETGMNGVGNTSGVREYNLQSSMIASGRKHRIIYFPSNDNRPDVDKQSV
jgi:hypothetical protein